MFMQRGSIFLFFRTFPSHGKVTISHNTISWNHDSFSKLIQIFVHFHKILFSSWTLNIAPERELFCTFCKNLSWIWYLFAFERKFSLFWFFSTRKFSSNFSRSFLFWNCNPQYLLYRKSFVSFLLFGFIYGRIVSFFKQKLNCFYLLLHLFNLFYLFIFYHT